jgi:mannosyltransferase
VWAPQTVPPYPERVTATVPHHGPPPPVSASPATAEVDTPGRFSSAFVFAVVAVGCGVVLRFVSTGQLWLDEALSVEIARRPLPQLFSALRRDGSPPLYYLLLHAWMAVFGTSTIAVRTLSSIISLAALPLAWYVGRAIGGRRLAAIMLLLVASTPWALRYSTETRMYTLVLVEVLAGVLILLWARANPTLRALAGITVITAALAYTHYWTLYLLAPVFGWLVWRREWRIAGAMVAAVVLFAPWLPSFAYQVRNTGTPWAVPADFKIFQSALVQWGGPGQVGSLLALLMIPLAVFGVAAIRRAGPHEPVILQPTGVPGIRVIAAFAIAPLLVAVLLGVFIHSGYAYRYTAVCLPFYLLLVARGLAVLPGRVLRNSVVAVVVVAGLYGGLTTATRERTQAGQIAATLTAAARPGDVVAYCPDQLSPAVHRLLPASLGLIEIAYADPSGPALVNWVHYSQRVRALPPAQFSAQVLQAAGDHHDVWLVTQNGYRVFGGVCPQVEDVLSSERGAPTLDVTSQAGVDEPATLEHFPAVG